MAEMESITGKVIREWLCGSFCCPTLSETVKIGLNYALQIIVGVERTRFSKEVHKQSISTHRWPNFIQTNDRHCTIVLPVIASTVFHFGFCLLMFAYAFAPTDVLISEAICTIPWRQLNKVAPEIKPQKSFPEFIYPAWDI